MSPAILYVAVGVLLGPIGVGLVAPDLVHHGRLIESVSEAVLIFALFGAGLRLPFALEWPSWRAPVLFSVASMLATMVFVAAAAHLCFHLGFAAALVVGVILAPTDPLLASNARLPSTGDEAGVRTLLTAESALGALLGVPALMLGLGALGAHDLGREGVRWITVDLAWSLAGGLAIGWAGGAAVWRAFVRARSARESELPEELIAGATIALVYGGAMVLGVSALGAAFAAGVALSHGGRRDSGARLDGQAARFQSFSARLEQLGAVAVLLLLGALVHLRDVRPAAIIFALIVLVLVRPVAARLGLGFSGRPDGQQALATWFGMRGVVSLYLLSVAVNQGLGATLTRQLAGILPAVLVVCVALQSVASIRLVGVGDPLRRS